MTLKAVLRMDETVKSKKKHWVLLETTETKFALKALKQGDQPVRIVYFILDLNESKVILIALTAAVSRFSITFLHAVAFPATLSG